VISAREAARLQGFPDTYNFDPDPVNPPTKQKLAKWIGDAVPMPLGYAAAVSAYAGGVPNQRP
jgi:DNA (cytosine-5)-methyltransferase 1